MTRSDLTRILCDDNPQLRCRDIEAVVTVFFDAITVQLHGGQRAELRGFGTFFLREHAARSGLNPRTRTFYTKDVRRMPRFKASKKLLSLLNPTTRR